ncbi:Hypothetical predicted protein [Octopus vulgaris]|uniref:Uncharacterized protein n=1 Tax=Octopus vulgaris TaxID=6645 RepID=A0AA36B200_OCTVU|nr:Hypothetical predicted protein [Octopus vulgaris]
MSDLALDIFSKEVADDFCYDFWSGKLFVLIGTAVVYSACDEKLTIEDHTMTRINFRELSDIPRSVIRQGTYSAGVLALVHCS